jgi:hypothetical protein
MLGCHCSESLAFFSGLHMPPLCPLVSSIKENLAGILRGRSTTIGWSCLCREAQPWLVFALFFVNGCLCLLVSVVMHAVSTSF